MDVFTSVTLNYLPKARILGTTLKRLHPDWTLHLCICDWPTSSNWTPDPFDHLLWIDALGFDKGWIFKHSLVEICTAIKGSVARRLFEQGASKVMYLDPDIAVLNSLEAIERLLDEYPIILTPHQLD